MGFPAETQELVDGNPLVILNLDELILVIVALESILARLDVPIDRVLGSDVISEGIVIYIVLPIGKGSEIYIYTE